MLDLPTDKRGYPIPFIIAEDKHGTPRFQINDDTKVEQCIRFDLCAICGTHMGVKSKWLVGGPLSAFHAHGSYIDTPTHHACLQYALKVCPYLAVSRYQRRIDLANVAAGDFDELLLQDPTQSEERVPFFVAVNVKRYKVSRPGLGQRYLQPDRDYLAIELWNNGEQIHRDEALELFRAHNSSREYPSALKMLESLMPML